MTFNTKELLLEISLNPDLNVLRDTCDKSSCRKQTVIYFGHFSLKNGLENLMLLNKGGNLSQPDIGSFVLEFESTCHCLTTNSFITLNPLCYLMEAKFLYTPWHLNIDIVLTQLSI